MAKMGAQRAQLEGQIRAAAQEVAGQQHEIVEPPQETQAHRQALKNAAIILKIRVVQYNRPMKPYKEATGYPTPECETRRRAQQAV